MTRNTQTLMRRTALSVLIGAIAAPAPALAAPFSMAQYPAGTMAKLPAPNVIVSVDDSGSMGSTGMATLRTALQQTFSTANIPDGAIRLGWQAMTGCYTIPSAGNCSNENRVRVLDTAHRQRFMTWVNTLKTESGTPSHRMYFNAGQYYRQPMGINSPWASEPGVKEQPVLTCRRSYNLFMTDGGYNDFTNWWTSNEAAAAEIKNADGTNRTLGDGTTSYNASAAQTRIYSDTYGNTGTPSNSRWPTMADMAFHFWATDLQSSIANEVKPLIKEAGNVAVSPSFTLQQYWNPKNNPATWQHMTTYTVGFQTASSWTAQPRFNGTDTWSGTNYTALLLGNSSWTNVDSEDKRRTELWHMALNSRGKFIPAPTAESLAPAFKDILNEIINDNSMPITSTASASTSVARVGTTGFTAGYVADKWKGYVDSQVIAQGSGATNLNPGWGGQTTADKLDALDATALTNRLILTWREGSVSPTLDGPAVFKWADNQSNLSTVQKALLFTSPEAATEGQARLNYVRGVRDRETSGSPRFRTRASRQGDIVNSRVWYLAQPVSSYGFDGYASFANQHKTRLPMVYVGGNDGMLHGFSAADGSEKIAYVPKGVIPNLRLLSQSDYDLNHRYFVDGSPFSGDVNWGTADTPNWRTLLVGTLGAGGKGYFVLDVTTPGDTTSAGPASNFSESNLASLVVMDKTAPSNTSFTETDASYGYIGQITVPPVVEDTNPYKVTQITRLNNGRWALVMGNGYNSTNEQPALLIQYLDGAKELTHIAAGTAGDANSVGNGNGLSAPRLVDLDGDGTTDVVYAGDLKGNLWKFNLLSATASGWNVAFSGSPLYTATYSGAAQPITAPPIVRANSRGVGGLMVAFGTGRNLTTADRETTSKQTIYSVRDSTRYRRNAGALAIETAGQALGSDVTALVEQMQEGSIVNANGRSYGELSANTVEFTGANAKQGWFFHLPEVGERMLDPMAFFDGSNLLEVISEIPAKGSEEVGETCNPSSRPVRKFRTFLNIMDGKPPSIQIIDLNGDGYYNLTTDGGVSRMTAPPSETRYDSGDRTLRAAAGGTDIDRLRRMPVLSLRPDWRQLQ